MCTIICCTKFKNFTRITVVTEVENIGFSFFYDNIFINNTIKIKIINREELIYESNEKSKSDIAYELLDVLL